jgi:hypothetical protein
MKLKNLLIPLVAALNLSAFGSQVASWSAEGNAIENGTSVAGSVNNVTYTTGRVGQAFDFAGAGKVDFGSTYGNFGTNDFTIDFWIRTTSTSKQAILCKRPICDAWNMFDFRLIEDGSIRFEVSESPFVYGFAMGGNVNDGQYHHVAGVRNNTNILLYVDGVLVASGSDQVVANVTSSSPLVLGQGPCNVDGTSGFVGQLDEISIYNEALSANSIYAIFAPNTVAIVSQPKNQKVVTGGIAKFSVSAFGPGTITYQWQFNGADIADATSNNLTVAPAQPENAGTYTVVVSSTTNSVTSQSATLQVIDASAIPPLQPIAYWKADGNGTDSIGSHDAIQINCEYANGISGQDFYIHEGETVNFGSEVANFGTNDFTVSFWAKASSGKLALLAKRLSCSEYNMFDFRHEWGYIRFEVAQTPYDYASINAPFTLDGQLHLVVGVRQGVNVLLYIDGILANSTTTPYVVNVSSDAPLLLGDEPCEGVDGTGPLTGEVDELQLFDRALSPDEIYSLYSPNSGIAIIKQPVDTLVVSGDSAILSVKALSALVLSYQWQFNGTNIADATNSTLTISGAHDADQGAYAVQITDINGQTTTSATAQLTVVGLSGVTIPGAVARWPGDDNANDVLGNYNAESCTATFGPGMVGDAFHFDGSQTVSFGNQVGNFGTGDFSIGFWLKTSVTGARQSILNKRPVCDDDHMFCFRVMEDGTVNFEVGDHSGYGGMAIGGHATDGTFHHYVGVRKGHDQFLYQDGILVGSTSLPQLMDVTSDAPFIMGVDACVGTDGSQMLQGVIDEVEVYGRALSVTEIYALSHPAAMAPRIVIEPTDLTAALGDKPALRVVARGRGTLHYQWKLNGVDIPGGTGTSLPLGTITADKAGDYSVEVSSRFGSVISHVATVDLMLGPGQYQGLFLSDDGSDAATGGFTLNLNRSKVFSGVLQQHGYRFPFTGKLSDSGTTVAVRKPAMFGQPASTLNLNLRPIKSGDYDTIRGTVQDSTWQSSLMSRHIRPAYLGAASQRGRHTLALPTASGVSGPNGSGFGNITVANNGTLTLMGVLGDSTSVSQSSALTKNGEWPVYIPLYKGAGSVSGWLNVSNTTAGSCTGVLQWNKTTSYGKIFANPFQAKIPVAGSPLSTTQDLGASLKNAAVVLHGAGLGTQITTTTSVSGQTVTFDGSNGSATFTPSNGRFSGKHYNPVTKSSEPIKGVILQQQQMASGYFLTTTNSGLLLMEKK